MIKFEAGQKYKKIDLPYAFKPVTIHIDYVLETLYEDNLVIYRFWSKTKQAWLYRISFEFELEMYINRSQEVA